MNTDSDRHATLSIESTSPEQTETLGRLLGRAAQGGELLALQGELGAGKTVLVRGLARGLDVPSDEPVTSPTFVLEAEYDGRLRLLHIDTYRLPDAASFEMLGALPAPAERADTLVAVEWADRIVDALPEDRLTVAIAHTSPESRSVAITATGPKSQHWLQRAKADLAETAD